MAGMPEWLPEGWTMRVKVRKDGKVDKYYTSLSSGFTYRSKPEVMHCIDIEQNVGQITSITSCIGGKNKRMVKKLTDQATRTKPCFRYKMMKVSSTRQLKRKNRTMQVGISPEGLPFGWIMEIKTRQSGVHQGQHYKCYVDPFTRSKFYSKRAVFRYLESGELHTSLSSRKRSTKTNSSLGCTSSNQRESINKKLSDNVRKANTDQGVRKDQLPIAAKNQIPPGTSVRRRLFSGLVPNSNAMTVIKNDGESKKLVLPLRSYRPAQGMEGANSSSLISNTVPNLPCQGDVIPPHSVTGEPPKVGALHKSERKELDMVNEKLPKMEELENRKLLQSGNEEFLASEDGLSEERNLELMNMKLSQPAHAKPLRGRKNRRGRKKHGVAEVDSSQKQEKRALLRPRKPKAFKAITLPLRSSRRLAGIEAGPGISNLPPQGMVKMSEKYPSSSIVGTDRSGVTHQTTGSFDEQKATPAAELESLKMIKCKEPNVQQAAQGEQVVEGKLEDLSPGSPLVLPFGDSWPDPCLEFAFKTLTGDIPVLEDTAGIEEYFQQLLISVKSPSLSNTDPSTLTSPANFSQAELHAQHPVHDRRQCSVENGLQGGRNVNNSCR